MATEFVIKGDFPEFKRFIDAGRLNQNLQREIKKATIKNSLFLIKMIGQRIREKKYEPNSPMTIALKNSDIPLINQKNMLDAISHKLESAFVSEVGFIRSAESTGGVTGKTIDMKKLVELMHTGYTIEVTNKMRVALFAALKEKDPSGNVGKMGKGGEAKSFYRVPSRPFMEETFKDPGIDRMLKQNWRRALELTYKAQGAKGGEHRDR